MVERSTSASAIAGFAGSLASSSLYPLEMIKVRLIASGVKSIHSINYKNAYHVLKSMVSSQGILSLYKGAHISFASSFAWTLYFYIYEEAKKMHPKWFKEEHSELYLFSVAAEAAILSRLITNPLWVIKTRVMLQNNSKSWYGDTFEAINKIYRLDGIKGFYFGIIPGLVLCSHGAFQLYFYEHLKAILDSQDSSIKTAISGGLSKLLTTLVLYPMQSTMIRLQQEQYPSYLNTKAQDLPKEIKEEKFFKGFKNCILKTFKNEGYKGFYRGFSLQLARILPSNALFFVVYEKIYGLVSNREK